MLTWIRNTLYPRDFKFYSIAMSYMPLVHFELGRGDAENIHTSEKYWTIQLKRVKFDECSFGCLSTHNVVKVMLFLFHRETRALSSYHPRMCHLFTALPSSCHAAMQSHFLLPLCERCCSQEQKMCPLPSRSTGRILSKPSSGKKESYFFCVRKSRNRQLTFQTTLSDIMHIIFFSELCWWTAMVTYYWS